MEKTNFTQNDEIAKSHTGFSNHLETTLTSGTTDHVTIEAIGGESVEAMPKHYYRSPQFIATFLVVPPFRQGNAMSKLTRLTVSIVDGIGISGRFYLLRDGRWADSHHQRRYWYEAETKILERKLIHVFQVQARR